MTEGALPFVLASEQHRSSCGHIVMVAQRQARTGPCSPTKDLSSTGVTGCHKARHALHSLPMRRPGH